MRGEQSREQVGVASSIARLSPSGSSPRPRRSSATQLGELVGVGEVAVVAEREEPVAVARKVGWAFSQTLAPVVE